MVLLFPLFFLLVVTRSASFFISCVGDSLTFGMGTTVVDKTSYPAMLAHYVERHGLEVGNFGASGTTAINSGGSSYWETEEYQKALKSNPNAVILMLGTNDATRPSLWNEALFVEDYTKLIRSFQELPSHPATFLGIPPPLYSDMATPLNTDLPRIIQAIASQVNASVIDLFTLLGGVNKTTPFAISHDGMHPNDIGYLLIARTVAAKILDYYHSTPLQQEFAKSTPNSAAIKDLEAERSKKLEEVQKDRNGFSNSMQYRHEIWHPRKPNT